MVRDLLKEYSLMRNNKLNVFQLWICNLEKLTIISH